MYLKSSRDKRLSLLHYSNHGYISTRDLLVDKSRIYSIEQQYPSENDIHVINKIYRNIKLFFYY
jgi:hypothetical protein